MGDTRPRILDLEKSRFDLDTFLGRLKHYANITDPRAAFVSTAKLEAAKQLLISYRENRAPEGTTEAELFRAQKLVQSAFHPDTGELQNVFGRMSFQVPGGTILIAAMLAWYRSNTAVIFWQWANQSFNALVNYTNRNAKSSLTEKQIGVAYVSATASALVTSLGLKAYLGKRGGSLAQRMVPLVAVWAANSVNIPLMRQNELTDGVVLSDEENNEITKSKVAAVKAVSLVIFSRLVLVTPAMLLTPIAMERIEKALWFQRNRRLFNVPLQAGMTALFLLFMVPTGCALFPQRNWITAETLKKREAPVYDEVCRKLGRNWDVRSNKLYFNKGL